MKELVLRFDTEEVFNKVFDMLYSSEMAMTYKINEVEPTKDEQEYFDNF